MLEKGTIVFGNWTVEETIGSGAFGTVYKIKKEDFGEEYFAAMKVIRIPQDKDDKSRLYSEGMSDEDISLYYKQIAGDFIKEIKMLSALDGVTNIVDYKDHVIEPNEDFGYTIYIKMQLLTPVSRLLVGEGNKAKFLSNEDIIRLGKDMCSALEVCEKKRIIHRDVKIDNIFVSDEGDYKLGDFGIARQLEATQGEMSKKGTLLYMAPEVFKGEKYDRTADIYSLGIVLYRLLNKNRAPFYPDYPNPIKLTDKESANAKRLKGDELPDIAGVSAELNAVLKKACAYNPRDRYQSASEFKMALEGMDDALIAPVIIPPVAAVDSENTEADGTTVGLFSTMTTVPAVNIGKSDDATVAAGNIPDDATEGACKNPSLVESDFTVTQGIFAEAVGSDTIFDKETVTIAEPDEKTASVFSGAEADNGLNADKKEENKEPAEDKKKKKVAIIIIIALILLIAVGVGIFLFMNRGSDKGDSGNADNSTTTTTLQANVTDEPTSSSVGVVDGTTVTVGVETPTIAPTVSVPDNGGGNEIVTEAIKPVMVSVPYVVGKYADDAFDLLHSKGLYVYVEYEKNENVSENYVISQSISSGTEVEEGSSITIVISSGRQTVDVANVVGKSRSDAEYILENQGLYVDIVEEYNSSVSSGVVISQSPYAGSALLPGYTVTIYVSKGKQPVTVSFNANGGSVSTSSSTVYVSSTYGTLPTPTRTGYSFNGWYTSSSGGSKVSSSTTVVYTYNHTLYAQWSPVSVNVKYDAMGGTLTTKNKVVTYGNSYGNLTTPTKTGYTFKGWFTSSSGGTQVTSSTIVTNHKEHTLYAQWTQNGPSGWVDESQVPAGAEIISTRYVYDKKTRSTTTSTASSLSGWTRYDKKTETTYKTVTYYNYYVYGLYGWNKDKGYYDYTLQYSSLKSGNSNGIIEIYKAWYPGATDAQAKANCYCITYSSKTPLGGGSFVNKKVNTLTGCTVESLDGKTKKTNITINNTTFYTNGTTSKQEANGTKTTYYYEKYTTETGLISTTYPTSSSGNVTIYNVKKQVQYRMK